MIKVKYLQARPLRDCATELSACCTIPIAASASGTHERAAPAQQEKLSFGKEGASFVGVSASVWKIKHVCRPGGQSTAFDVGLRNPVVLRSVRSPALQMLRVLTQTSTLSE